MNVIGYIARCNQQLQTTIGKDLSSLEDYQDIIENCTLSVGNDGLPTFEKKANSFWSVAKQYLPSVFGGVSEKKAVNASIARITQIFDTFVPKDTSSKLRRQIDRLLDIFSVCCSATLSKENVLDSVSEKDSSEYLKGSVENSEVEESCIDTTNSENWLDSDSELCSLTTSVVDSEEDRVRNGQHSSIGRVPSRYKMYQGHTVSNTSIVYRQIERYERLYKQIFEYLQKNPTKRTKEIEKDLQDFVSELHLYKNLVAHARDGNWNQIRQFKWVNRKAPRGWNDVIKQPKQHFFPLIASKNIWRGLRSQSDTFKKIFGIEPIAPNSLRNPKTSQSSYNRSGCYQEEICGEWTKKSPLIYEKRYLRDEHIDYLVDIAPLEKFLDDNAGLSDKEIGAVNFSISKEDARSLNRGNSSSWREWKKFIDDVSKMEEALQELQSKARNNEELQLNTNNGKVAENYASTDQDDDINVDEINLEEYDEVFLSQIVELETALRRYQSKINTA